MASTITSIVTQTVTAKPTSTTASNARAAPQGGIIQGANPSKYDPKNPIITFIIQAGIIIIFCRLLHFPLSKIRQPRVIAEIIGGILLGPSVFGRIPGFTDAIFPTASMPTLSLAANLGLVFFLFLVGLEVDLRFLVSNWRIALGVGAAGMALPFGLGCAIAYGLYHEFRTDPGLVPISFGTYMLFVGVAMAITAFPVLCRILTELKLLQTQVGIVVLSAGVGNDVVGWILLALCVALVNAGSGIIALYVFLTAIAYVLFLVYIIRPAFLWILKRTGSLQNGPTQSVVALTLLMTLASAFFTGIIGVHPIFGAFLIGLLCPHDGGFAIKLTEKIEDLVTVFFLPLYFALSGLSTNIGLLDTGITWAYVIGVIAIAFIGKFVGGTLAARLCKLVWRESFTIGVLMSCKGLVELIVLNIGYQAKILSQRTFTIFVVMALVTTFATTPLTSALYPPWYQKKLLSWRRGEIDWEGNPTGSSPETDDADSGTLEKREASEIRRILVYLRLESLPSLFTFVSLLGKDQSISPVAKMHPNRAGDKMDNNSNNNSPRKKPLEVHGVRMLELSERLSSVMKGSEIDEHSAKDPVVNTFYSFGQLNNLAVSGEVEIVPDGQYSDLLSRAASEQSSDLVLLPWSETGIIADFDQSSFPGPPPEALSKGPHAHFILDFLAKSPCNTAILVNNGFGASLRDEIGQLTRSVSGVSLRSTRILPLKPIIDRSHHIFLPFFGGPDDRIAVRFVLSLARNAHVTATILHLDRNDVGTIAESEITSEKSQSSRHSGKNQVNVAVSFSREKFFEQEKSFILSIRDSLPRDLEPRLSFATLDTTRPLGDAVARAKSEVGKSVGNAGDLVVVGRGQTYRNGFKDELDALVASEKRSSGDSSEIDPVLGEAAGAMMAANVKASLLVLQAGGR